MTPAQRLTNEIRLAVSKIGTRLFNVQVGKFWAGRAQRYDRAQTIQVQPGDVLIRHARLINSGIPGMADLIGATPVVVTPEMVGTTVAVYTSVEVKAGKDRPTPEQLAWAKAVLEMGGQAGIAHSPEEAVAICQNGISSFRS